jgi:ankyrin repeat protein
VTYIIVDALDECPNTSDVVSPRDQVLNLVEELANLSLPNLRLCITSRREADIIPVLEPLASHAVSLHDQNGQKEDISFYVKSVVHSDRRVRKWRVEDKELVIESLVRKANGMYVVGIAVHHQLFTIPRRFRWVACQLNSLLPCFPASIRAALEKLPKTLDETYEHILLGIDAENREYAHRLLQCLAVSVRPLCVEELAEVLGIQFHSGQPSDYHVDWRPQDLKEAEDAVLSACSSLIVIVNVDGCQVVQFAHFSVKEFLTSDRLAKAGENLSRYHIIPQPAHMILAQACLSALLRLDDNIDKSRMKDFPLSIYAAHHWVDHGQFENVSSSIQELMDRLFDPEKPHFATWVWIYDVDQPWDWVEHMSSRRPTRPEAVPLYYATLCGFHGLLEHLIVSYPRDVNARGGTYATPLHAALTKGYFNIALMLLEHGADVNDLDYRGYSPLNKASETGRRDVVEFLLGPHPDIYVQNGTGDDVPLGAVSRNESEVKPVPLRWGVDVDSRNCDGWTSLMTATVYGHPDIVQLLLRKGANVESRPKEGKTPIMQASARGKLDVVQLLLQNGAAVDSRDHDGWTPLTIASKNGQQDVVQLLLQNGASVDSRSIEGWTPLMSASKWGHLDLVQTLLDQGAAVDSNTQEGETALHAASRSGKPKVVRSLIERGANVNSRKNDGSTPCHEASQNGHLDVVSLLIDHGTDVDAQNANSKTPLAMASQNGQLEVSGFLIEHGADVNSTDGKGSTLLHFASQRGHLNNLRLLLDHGANVNAQNSDLWTSLHLASFGGHSDVAELLIQRGADVHIQNKEQETALHLASDGRLEVVCLLVKCGSVGDSKDGKGWTPLHTAARSGHLDIVEFLLESGADVNMQNSNEETPLDLARGNGKRKVAIFLAERMGMGDVDSWVGTVTGVTTPDGASPNTDSDVVESLVNPGEIPNALDDGKTSLYTASEQGNLDIVRTLLIRGADVNERGPNNQTPLDVASWEGRLEVAALLIQHGANVNCRDRDGWTPLHTASRFGRLDVVRLLLDHGVDVDAKQQNHWTPLHLASMNGHLEIVKLLLEWGANVHVQDVAGRTPFQEAFVDGRREITQLLSEYGGR